MLVVARIAQVSALATSARDGRVTAYARVERALADLGGERCARLEREIAELRDALGG
ncbi:MAG: hypothetical protein ACR2KV_11010 [Solirubrobacteraceae bacterium]